MRLVILSNRLKITVTEEDGVITYLPSSGGLISGLGAYLDTLNIDDYLWIGWPGSYSYTKTGKITKDLLKNYNSFPVFVEENTMNMFYNGFCNNTLWPLFHYFPGLTVFDEKMWAVYQEVNALFAAEVLKQLLPGDVLWIHDYHLMLVPRLIREKRADIPIGFFLHIPFPNYEIFRLLPRKWGKEILKGILDADLIGFHTYDYSQYFLRCVLRILGFHNNMGLIKLNKKLTKVDTYPIGIDFKRYYEASELETVKNEKELIRAEIPNMKIIFSVDRQDYTKGIQNRLIGFELFLKHYPEWHEKVILIMIIVPSRTGVDEYQNARNEINQLISKINGDYGNIHWTPVIFQYRSISFEQLIAYYNLSDVGLVTPLRDGMNLVAKEFVAAQCDKKGVLILSEMAGTAMELGEAIIINPNYSEEIADAIKEALEMTDEERFKRNTLMQERLKNNDILKWANNFVTDIQKAWQGQKSYGTTYLTGQELDLMINKFRSADNRIILLDYDGTLVPFAKSPSDAVPNRKSISIVKLLSKFPGNEVVIISGRKKEELNNWYGSYDVTLVAEHGVWLKKPKGKWKMIKKLSNDWKQDIFKIMDNFKVMLPNSFIEEKDYSLAWHFRNSDESISTLRVKEFVDTVTHMSQNDGIEVLFGNKVVEIKCSSISKGEMAKHLINSGEYGFILAAGDDATDETLFSSLPEGSFTIKIGKGKSFANYYLNTSMELLNTLEKLITSKKSLKNNLLNLIKLRK